MYVVELTRQMYGPFATRELARDWAVQNSVGGRYLIHLLYSATYGPEPK
jgi:hypothetical protein